METTIKFTNEVTLENLNPLNYALKNEYIGNLISTGALILPRVQDHLAFPVVVKKAMVNRNIMLSLGRSKFQVEEDLKDKFMKGLAITISWHDFNAVTAMEAIQGVMSSTDEKLTVIINEDDSYVSFYRGTKTRQILEISDTINTNDHVRIVKDYNSV